MAEHEPCIRQTALPDQHQYFLDGAVEEFEITATTWLVLNLYGDADRIAAILDADAGMRFSLRRRRAQAIELGHYAAELLPFMPEAQRRAALAQGTQSLRRAARETLPVLSGWAFEDERKGGCQKPFRRIWRCRHDGRPTPKVARQLYSPAWIRRFVRHNDFVAGLREVARRHLELTTRWPEPADPTDRAAIEAAIDAQLRLNRERRDAAHLAARMASEQHTPMKPAALRRQVQRGRRVVRRAAVAAAALLGAATVSAFARGEPVVLPGQELQLQVRRAGPLAGIGHGHLDVKVLDRSGVDLAALCVYIRETPALDQLTAFALHMQAGLEAELLATANIVRTTEAGDAHPALAERAAKRAAAPPPERVPLLGLGWQIERDLQTRYLADTLAIWAETVAVSVFGRQWREFLTEESA